MFTIVWRRELFSMEQLSRYGLVGLTKKTDIHFFTHGMNDIKIVHFCKTIEIAGKI